MAQYTVTINSSFDASPEALAVESQLDSILFVNTSTVAVSINPLSLGTNTAPPGITVPAATPGGANGQAVMHLFPYFTFCYYIVPAGASTSYGAYGVQIQNNPIPIMIAGGNATPSVVAIPANGKVIFVAQDNTYTILWTSTSTNPFNPAITTIGPTSGQSCQAITTGDLTYQISVPGGHGRRNGGTVKVKGSR